MSEEKEKEVVKKLDANLGAQGKPQLQTKPKANPSPRGRQALLLKPLPQRQAGTSPKAPPHKRTGTPPRDCSMLLTLRLHNETSPTQKGVDSESKRF